MKGQLNQINRGHMFTTQRNSASNLSEDTRTAPIRTVASRDGRNQEGLKYKAAKHSFDLSQKMKALSDKRQTYVKSAHGDGGGDYGE